jgi:hypothetical protein
MRGAEFSDYTKINKEFVHDHPVSDTVEQALYNDPWYGLSNPDNYMHWQALMVTSDPLERLSWKAEIRSYFGLT